jgi:hypothetical protein
MKEMLMRTLKSFASLTLLALAGCPYDKVMPYHPENLSVGTWGGDNAAAIVNDTIAHIHIKCTFGDVKMPIALDTDGRFTANGSYVLRAYPVYVGPELPAVFSGSVNNRQLTFSVLVHDTVAKRDTTLGPATVILGDDPKMGPCPICTVPGMRTRMKADPE